MCIRDRYKEAGKILSQVILFLLIIAVIVILFSSIISPIILKSIIDSESVLQAVLQYQMCIRDRYWILKGE